MEPKFLLFLDFDGVVKHKGTNSLQPHCIKLVRVLLNRLDAHLVISSAWRTVADMNRLNPIFDGRIIGTTPDLFYEKRDSPFLRYREVLAFLEVHGWRDVPWIALDDDPTNYPPTAPVHITDPEALLTRADAEAVLEKYEKH